MSIMPRRMQFSTVFLQINSDRVKASKILFNQAVKYAFSLNKTINSKVLVSVYFTRSTVFSLASFALFNTSLILAYKFFQSVIYYLINNEVLIYAFFD